MNSNSTIDLSTIDTKISGNKQMYSISSINASNGNKRTQFSNSLYSDLKSPRKVNIAFTKNSCYISRGSLENSESFEFSPSGKPIIYNSRLVLLFTQIFELDFTGKSSITFNNIKIKKIKKTNGKTQMIAVVTVGKEIKEPREAPKNLTTAKPTRKKKKRHQK